MSRLITTRDLGGTDTVRIARWLVGRHLVRVRGRTRTVHRITEVEAYDGENDLACHASRGPTPRTRVMYGPAGCWYVYLIYGMHPMLNVVTGPKGYPAAVLIRGIEGVSGPCRVTKRLRISMLFNNKKANRRSGLYLEDPGESVPQGRVRATPRIGVDYAGPVWAAKPWRFVLETQGRQNMRTKMARPAEHGGRQ